jgi:hypothetical protein
LLVAALKIRTGEERFMQTNRQLVAAVVLTFAGAFAAPRAIAQQFEVGALGMISTYRSVGFPGTACCNLSPGARALPAIPAEQDVRRTRALPLRPLRESGV